MFVHTHDTRGSSFSCDVSSGVLVVMAFSCDVSYGVLVFMALERKKET